MSEKMVSKPIVPPRRTTQTSQVQTSQNVPQESTSSSSSSTNMTKSRSRANTNVSSGSNDNVDSTGRFLRYDVREDEEQSVKLQEIIDLLVAGGYFRARIKGLNNFDKIVGGMSWAIEMCNIDLDVDILFQESLTIGQKIALTEKIVKVLQSMKCPHQLEPHQVQGMDCIHIFPVIQWLVKKSLETRSQMGEYLKRYSSWQFNKSHVWSQERHLEETLKQEKMSKSMSDADTSRHPHRKYRHPGRHKIRDEKTRVRTTLLEYGKFGSSQSRDESGQGSTSAKNESEKTSRKTSLSEDTQMESLISSLTESPTHRVSASLVGTIVGAQSDEIARLAEEYQRQKSQLDERQTKEMRAEMLLRRKIEMAKNELVLAQENDTKHQEKIELLKEQIGRVKERQMEYKPMDGVESETQQEREEKRNLSQLVDALKKQKSEFKVTCREEKVRIEKLIEDLSHSHTDTEEEGVENELEIELEAERERHAKLKLQLASMNKESARISRKLDDIPSRAELSQYQKRFIELYNQVSGKHNETKKFYTLYNSLDDERMYLQKEFNLLNSILDNFHQAKESTTGKEQFILQFDQIVEGIKQTKLKVETRRQTEKAKRDGLNEQYLDLIEKQRLYFKAVKDFKEECRKNETLIGKIQEEKNDAKIEEKHDRKESLSSSPPL